MLPPAAADSSTAQPEDTVGFTTLDHVLIKTIVAALTGVEGSMSVDQARDVVDELIHLTTDRHRSYFHRGFLETLTSGQVPQTFPEENAARRTWSLAGRLMALTRKGDRSGICRLVATERQAVEELMTLPEAVPAAIMVAPQLVEALWENQHYADLAIVDHRVAAAAGLPLLRRLLRAGRDLFLLHRTAEASLVLDLLENAVGHLRDDPPPQAFLSELRRRRAQILRAGGHFARAKEAFERLAGTSENPLDSPTQTDIALCAGSFEWLSDVAVPTDAASVPDMLSRLDQAQPAAQAALRNPHGFLTNAQYILGVRALLRDESDEARAFLEEAYAGMSARRELYRDAFSKCRLYYSLAILRSLHAPQFAIAREIIEQTGEDHDFRDWPPWLMRQAFEFAQAAPSEAVALAEWTTNRFPVLAEDLLLNADLVSRSEALQELIKARITSDARPIESRWNEAKTLLTCAQRSGDSAVGRGALDVLEELALLSPSVRERCSEFLADQQNYDPMWSWEEAQFCRAHLLELDGHCNDAGLILATLIHSALTQDDREGARGLYEHLRSLGDSCPPFPEVDARIRALEDGSAPTPAVDAGTLATGPRIRVLFVGGNETQARYDAWIVGELRDRYPQVTVTFEHTGWTSNWGVQAERIERLMADHDAAIVMRFVRTELGRRVRDDVGRLGKRWFPCTGHGRDSVLRAIVQAASLV